jgi:mercuric reductase
MIDRDADLLILGSGSTAFAAALRARELGKTAIMTENRTVGGTCVNRGCLPSKNLIEAARILHEANHPPYPGLTGEVRLAFADLIAQKDQLVEDYRRKKYESLIDGRIRIERGHAHFVAPHTLEIDGRRLRGEKILIAMGSRPIEPSIKGLDRVPYLTSDLLTVGEGQELKNLPESLLIIGGGYIALELGQMFQRFGTQVTVLERSAQVLAHGYEPEVGQAIQQILVNEGVRIVTEANIQDVQQQNKEIIVHAVLHNRSRSFQAQLLLVAVGRRPNTDRISIEKSGVRLGEHGEVTVNEHLRTNIEHIFAAGDVIGTAHGSQLATPVGSHDGGIAAHNALSKGDVRKVDHRVIPRSIFTDPQIGLVGMTEEEAIAASHPCWCNTVPMELVPRAGAIRDTRGLIKMLADAQTNEVLGVSMVGHNAGEVIHEAAMAMRFHAKLQDFIDLIHVYPTMAEALKIAAISRYKDPEKLSCCAE